jgi:hypothetical protein
MNRRGLPRLVKSPALASVGDSPPRHSELSERSALTRRTAGYGHRLVRKSSLVTALHASKHGNPYTLRRSNDLSQI